MFAETQRISALKSCALLDTAPHPAFDCLTRAAALAFEVPFALISLVDTDRQWFKSALGVSLRETSRAISFCSHAIQGFEPMVVPDTQRDTRFVNNPLVTGEPHVRFYAGAPLINPDGYALGTLCVLDRRPRTLSEQQVRLLGHLADAVMHAIEAHCQRLETSEVSRQLHSQSQSATVPGVFPRRA